MVKRRKSTHNLPERANKILNGIVIVLMLVVVKIWHLSVVQHDKKKEEATKPQRRVVIERCERATITDRFNIPMAINKVQYNAAISYGPIRSLPRTIWQKDAKGRREKIFFRKEYITKVSEKLAEELNLDPERIEDLIHSKAAILGNVPCLLKENISEEQYFRLKMLEKDWPGILGEIGARRCYPLGSVGGEVIGYIGPISKEEYDAITGEMRELREAISEYEEGQKPPSIEGVQSIEDVHARLEALEKKAYHINDYVGKMGIEAAFDKELRGLRGKQLYLSDIHGKFLQELPGSEQATSGSHLVLTLSSELQAYAEQLLAEYESSAPSPHPTAVQKRELMPKNQPWMKGGGIVAMHPKTGEVYAMATFPRFDPNDFIRTGDQEEVAEKNRLVNRWLETESYLASVWDLCEPFSRQRYVRSYQEYYEEQMELSWGVYLDFILPEHSPVKKALEITNSVADSLQVQQEFEKILCLFQNDEITISAAKLIDFIYPADKPLNVMVTLQEKEFIQTRLLQVAQQVELFKCALQPYFEAIGRNDDKLLLVDLYRLAVRADAFDAHLCQHFAHLSLEEYREISARFVSVKNAVRLIVKNLFEEHDFRAWREKYFQDFLAEKRKQELQANKKYARPYIEYLDGVHKELFDTFWEENQWDFILLFLTGQTDLGPTPYLEALSGWFDELKAGAHQGLSWVYHYNLLQTRLQAYPTSVLIPFIQTLRSFSTLDRPLLGRYFGLKGSKEKDLATAFYPTYGFGFARSHAFRQAATIGSIFKVVPAYEALKQKYLALKEQNRVIGDLNPLTIIDDKHRDWKKEGMWNVGYTLDGKAIPMYYRGGRLPRTEHAGLGAVDITRALEASSNPYFAMLAGDFMEDPEDMCRAANLLGYGEKTGIQLPGEYAGKIPIDVTYNRTGLYALSIGQHSLVGTPLQTAGMFAAIANGGAVLEPKIVKTKISETAVEETEPEVRWRVFMPPEIHSVLIKGLKQVIMGDKGTARFVRQQFDSALVNQIVGKTSTAEVIERVSLDGESGVLQLKHIGFGGVAYSPENSFEPELVVVVYLRYGDWGRDAAPLAFEMVKKWREISSNFCGEVSTKIE
ncbi:MAG: Peptidoglycan D,D-transpeptidase MrdA [Chlamydiales bacterium]|nr:Peptidoglycan D,D-transpeptidase MrdA [Chlamydiales bacterium]